MKSFRKFWKRLKLINMMNADSSEHFTHNITVSIDDIDGLNHVNNVVYIRWVQEIAEAHWHSVATAEFREKFIWVVLRHEVDYHRPVVIGDAVTGSTWVGDCRGARFERFVRLYNPFTQKVYAEAKTIWCLLDATIKKPLRIPEDVLALL